MERAAPLAGRGEKGGQVRPREVGAKRREGWQEGLDAGLLLWYE